MAKAVFCIATSEAQAEKIVNQGAEDIATAGEANVRADQIIA